jgi:hypothetical protein
MIRLRLSSVVDGIPKMGCAVVSLMSEGDVVGTTAAWVKQTTNRNRKARMQPPRANSSKDAEEQYAGNCGQPPDPHSLLRKAVPPKMCLLLAAAKRTGVQEMPQKVSYEVDTPETRMRPSGDRSTPPYDSRKSPSAEDAEAAYCQRRRRLGEYLLIAPILSLRTWCKSQGPASMPMYT